LGFSVQPSNTQAGSSITPAVQVQVQDANGNVVSNSTASITMALGANPSGGSLSGTNPVSAVNGIATFSNLSIDKTGSAYALTATSGTLNQAASNTLNITGTTTTAVRSSVNPSVFGQSVTFAAAVGVTSPGTGTPTGTVTFKDGTTTLGTGTLNGSSVAAFSTSALSLASHSITAVYGSDTNFVTSTSSVLPQTVNQSATTTILSSSVNPSAFGQSVTFTATVGAVAPGGGTPSGTVT